MLALKKTVWREKTRLTSPEFQAAATSKAWHYSGRTSLSPLQSRRTQKEGLLTGSPVICESLYEWWYTTMSIFLFCWGAHGDSQWCQQSASMRFQALRSCAKVRISCGRGGFSGLISFVAYSWIRILRSHLMKVQYSTLFYKNLPMFAISNIHTYPCKANHYKRSE